LADHHKIELSPPDIRPYRTGNTGVDYVHVRDSGKPGPTVMVQALTHGNEYCGAIALDHLFKQNLQPVQGKLILSFANVEAFSRFDHDDPDLARFVDEDYNRVWGEDVLGGPRDSAELRRARALRPFVDAADYLLDLHSMHEPCAPIMVCAQSEKSVALARRMGVPGHLLLDMSHPGGLRVVERGAFRDPKSPKVAILIESGQHWEKSAADIAIDTALRFLKVTGAASADWVNARLKLTPPAEQKLIRITQPVANKSTNFKFTDPYRGLECIPKKGTVIATDGDTPIRTPYDDCVLIMPSLRHSLPGTTMVRLGRYA
jgi:predicted deacylase